MIDDPSPPDGARTDNRVTVGVIVKDPGWLDAVLSLEALATEVVEKAMAMIPEWNTRVSPGQRPVEVSLCFAGDSFVRDLNAEFRGIDRPTNVLSFPGGEPDADGGAGEILIGDIVFALGVVRKEAAAQKKSIQDHTTHLMVHGLLHLFGYSHEEDDEAREMENLEIAILKRFGIGNPYG